MERKVAKPKGVDLSSIGMFRKLSELIE
jgi:hypothetical protein